MAQVATIARGRVRAADRGNLVDQYRGAIAAGLPPGLDATYLLTADPEEVAIVTIWHDRASLDAMRGSGQEPLAHRLIREAGGSPTVEVLEVAAASQGG